MIFNSLKLNCEVYNLSFTCRSIKLKMYNSTFFTIKLIFQRCNLRFIIISSKFTFAKLFFTSYKFSFTCIKLIIKRYKLNFMCIKYLFKKKCNKLKLIFINKIWKRYRSYFFPIGFSTNLARSTKSKFYALLNWNFSQTSDKSSSNHFYLIVSNKIRFCYWKFYTCSTS